MFKKLIYLLSFVVVLGLVGTASAALPPGWQSQDIGTTGGSADESGGTWTLSGDGADIWGSSDAFHFAYVPLSGNGMIVARVVDSGTGSNAWAKGGVMIRQTLDADSKHAIMALTGGNGGGKAFQCRPETGGSSFSSHGGDQVAPPMWVKLVREGNLFTGYYSTDGATWEQQPDGTGGDATTNPVEIEMMDPVLIGLFITSHADGEVRTYTFDNVSTELPRNATGPDPADGAMYADTFAVLTWSAGVEAVSHDVYLGDSFDNVAAGTADTFQGNQTTTNFSVADLVPGTTYYWRVDEINDLNPESPWTGDVWSFAVPPQIAYDPSPADGSGFNQLELTLSWTPGLGAIMHSVYFGEDAAALAPVSMMQMDTTCDPGPLVKDMTYYWRVDEFDGAGTHTGDVWSFKTFPTIAITDPNLVAWWKLDNEGFGTVVDSSGHDHHGTLRGDPQWVDGYDGGALELDGSGDYVNIDGWKGIAADRSDPDNPSQRPFTVACWVNTTTADGSLVCWGSRDGTGVGGQYQNFRLNGGRLRAEHGNGRFRGAARVDDGEWHHIAMVVSEGANIEIPGTLLFVDGVQDTEGADTVNAQNIWNITEDADVAIGVRASHGDRIYTGLFDDVRIYDYALTAEEIALVVRIDLLRAWDPSPADGSANQVADVTALSWSAGDGAIFHNVHFGTDAAVLAPVSMMQTDASCALPEALDFGQTYYWRVDEFNADGTTTTGRVWNFTIEDFLLVDDIEGYTDYEPDRIFDRWMDGWSSLINGSIVGYPRPDFAAGEHFVEANIVHGGSQSMPYFYDTLYKYSEATMTLDYPRDWTEQGVKLLSLWFQGRPAGMVEEPAGTYTMSAAGADIWGNSDEFRFAYKQISGDGSIVAQVLSVQHTNVWSKAGVMIRNTLDADSANALAMITPSGRVGWQHRVTAGDRSNSTRSDTDTITAPHWVKLTRAGNIITAEHSSDGVTWEPMIETANPDEPSSLEIEMNQDVYIGLALTSHQSGVTCVAEFSDVDVAIRGTTGPWTVQAIGIDMPANDPAPMYVAVANSDGTTAVVYNDNPNAAAIGDWTEWAINLQDFAAQGVDLTDVDNISIGFGDKDNLQAGGSGLVFFDDILLRRPLPYEYNGDAAAYGAPDGEEGFESLDGTWGHDNGSDKWDGTGPGEGMPGGAVALTEDEVTFLRIQDTGDPRDYGFSDPTNRKVYLTRPTEGGLDGATLEVRIRVATTPPLDDMHPDKGDATAPWPEGGIGYHIRDNGKGMFGISDGVVVISFSLAKAGEPDFEDVATDVLVMNNLVGTEPSGDVDTEDAAAAVAMNMIAVDDATQWNTFVIDIAAGGAGTHIVTVSVNGGPAESFEVTSGTDTEGDTPYITIGSSGTGGVTAFDLDYIKVSY